MKQGYFVRQIGSGDLPRNIEEHVREDIELVKKALNANPGYEIVPFLGEINCQLYSNKGLQPKDYDYGDRYNCTYNKRNASYKRKQS